MGFEYNFKITKTDIEALSRSTDGVNTVDKLLRKAPFFNTEVDSTYSYSEKTQNDKRWPATASLIDDGFCLCIYDRSSKSPDMALLNFLIHEVLDRCGRVELEDA